MSRDATTGVCRICGCTDADCRGCIERTGEACHWIEPDLCSACGPLDFDEIAALKRVLLDPPLLIDLPIIMDVLRLIDQVEAMKTAFAKELSESHEPYNEAVSALHEMGLVPVPVLVPNAVMYSGAHVDYEPFEIARQTIDGRSAWAFFAANGDMHFGFPTRAEALGCAAKMQDSNLPNSDARDCVPTL